MSTEGGLLKDGEEGPLVIQSAQTSCHKVHTFRGSSNLRKCMRDGNVLSGGKGQSCESGVSY